MELCGHVGWRLFIGIYFNLFATFARLKILELIFSYSSRSEITPCRCFADAVCFSFDSHEYRMHAELPILCEFPFKWSSKCVFRNNWIGPKSKGSEKKRNEIFRILLQFPLHLNVNYFQIVHYERNSIFNRRENSQGKRRKTAHIAKERAHRH